MSTQAGKLLLVVDDDEVIRDILPRAAFCGAGPGIGGCQAGGF